MNILVDREVEGIAKLYLFGHYDSRGGATAVIARNHVDAVKAYLAAFDPDGLRAYVQEREGEDAARKAVDDLVDAAQDDFLARYELRVCDVALPDAADELLEEYRDSDGYRFGVVQRRYSRSESGAPASKTKGRWSKWTDTDVAVLWQGPRQPSLSVSSRGLLDEQVRLQRRDVGEDAYGLVLVRAPLLR